MTRSEAAIAESTTDHAPLLERAFALDPVEGSYRIDRIEGRVPDFIRGSYYLNGPARFAFGGRRYRHWLDGDGMVAALHFSAEGVHFANRFVRGTKFRTEEAAGRPVFRAFGTAFADDQLKRGLGLESPVNVSIYRAMGTLLAFGEQGLPWELDPETLETRGEYSFRGALNPISPFSAHPNIDYATGELFNFGISFAAQRPCIHLYRFAPDGELVYRRRLHIDAPRSLHDFGLSPRYAVFYLSPHLLDMNRMLAEGATVLDSLTWEPERGSLLLVADRETGEMVTSVAIGSSYSLHQINCFESDDRLLVDVVELDRPVYDQYDVPRLFTEVRRAQPVRFEVDVEAGELVERRTLDFRLMCDFPAVDPRRATLDYRDFWVLAISATERPGRKFFDRVVRLDWQGGPAEAYQAPAGSYLCGEPVFLPDLGSERRGAVICQQFDAERETGAFLIFDAFDLAAGPVATLPLRHPIHLGFHASFEPEGRP